MEYGIQMYSLRDMTDVDLASGLRAAAEIGYKYVEFAGFYDHSAEEIKAMLDEYGLSVIGSHSNFDELYANFDQIVKFHQTIGNHNFVIPHYDFSQRKLIPRFIDKYNEIAPKLRDYGISISYHNHVDEFEETSEGYIIHKMLEDNCDILFELDTYWAYVAGLDPVAEIDRLGDRVHLIHLKDGSPDGKGTSLGNGTAPVAAVRKKAIERGIGILVESEELEPTGKEEVRRSMDYLKSLDSLENK